IPDRPISFEVLSDDLDEMERQARVIAQWGDNVYAKIPVTNTLGESSVDVVHSLTRAGIKVNVTALLALDQVLEVCAPLAPRPPLSPCSRVASPTPAAIRRRSWPRRSSCCALTRRSS